jgi:hypothetical protein
MNTYGLLRGCSETGSTQAEGMSDFIKWISWFSYQMVKEYEVLDTISSGGGVGGGL